MVLVHLIGRELEGVSHRRRPYLLSEVNDLHREDVACVLLPNEPHPTECSFADQLQEIKVLDARFPFATHRVRSAQRESVFH